MRRIERCSKDREYCLRRALELDWLAENARTQEGHDRCWAEARQWRSLALVAAPRPAAQAEPAAGE